MIKTLIQRGGFEKEGNYQERKEKYEKHSSSLEIFIKENCEIGSGFILCGNFLNIYRRYLKENGLNIPSVSSMGKVMATLGFKSKTKRIMDGTAKVYENLSWKDAIEDYLEPLSD